MVTMHRRARVRLLLAVAMAGISVVPSARAQTPARHHYDLPMDDLAQSLRAVSRLSGREIIFTSDVTGKRAPRLKGAFTAEDAVRALLLGSGLVAEFQPDVIYVRHGTPGKTSMTSPGESGGDIVVTGSHIRGETPISPVIAQSRTDIELRGRTDLGAFARDLPQNFSGGQNPGVIGSLQPGSENFNASSTLNLRCLGADATLTLLNGHRLAYDSVVQGVDISAIPLLAVERVEVVTDGSSALYGADAVGGVANIILRRDYEGLETNARLGAATDGGGEQQQYGAIGGHRWSSGGMFVAGEFNKSTAVTARQRDLTAGLNGSSILYPRLSSVSIAAAGHQDLSDRFEFSFDGHFSNRDATTAYSYLATADYRNTGNYGERNVRAYSISPRLKLQLPDGWQVNLLGTVGSSQSTAWVTNFSGGRTLSLNEVHYDNDIRSIELNADGPLLQLPAGPLEIAVGAGYREITLDANIRATRSSVTTTTLDFEERQKISFAFGELSVPVIASSDPGALIRSLRFTGAGRFENYAGIASTVTPKFGGKLGLGGGISLSASWGRSFKAPTLSQASRAATGDLLPASDFLPTAPGGLPVLLLGGTKPGLGPETASSWTTTLEIKPPFMHGLTLQATYFSVIYKNRVMEPFTDTTSAFSSAIYSDLITLSPSSAQINAIVQGLPLGVTNQTGNAVDPANVGAILDNRLQNIARQTIDGIDLSLNYECPVGGDRIAVSANGSYLNSRFQLSPLQPLVDRAGLIFTPPHWRANMSGTWSHDDVTVTGVVNYIGGTRDDRLVPVTRVGSFTTVDLVARLQSGEEHGPFKGAALTIALNNLLNSYPDRIRTSSSVAPPYDATNYSILGRVISLSLSKRW